MDQPHIKTERRKATINELLDAHVAYMRRKNRASVQTVEQVLDDAKIRLAPSKLFRLIREPAECDEQTELFRVHIPVKGFHCRVTDGRVFATPSNSTFTIPPCSKLLHISASPAKPK
jgi:hypothetical protein